MQSLQFKNTESTIFYQS